MTPGVVHEVFESSLPRVRLEASAAYWDFWMPRRCTGLPMPVRRSFLLDATTLSPHFSSYSSVNQAGAGRLFERSGERAIFLAVGAGERGIQCRAFRALKQGYVLFGVC